MSFDKVRNSCAQFVPHCTLVRVSDEKIAQFAQQQVLDRLGQFPDSFANLEDPTQVPLKFDSLNQEINFFFLYAALQFGSGFRKELHDACDRGAADTMLYGLLGMVLNDCKLDAEFLVRFGLFDVEQFFGFPIKTEQPSKVHPAIKVSVDSELKLLADGIVLTFNEIGSKLMNRQAKDVATWILEVLAENPLADNLVNELVSMFPNVFDDKQLLSVESNPSAPEMMVYFYKKAQLCVAELHKNLKHKNKLFNFPDIYQCTMFVDNVLPAVLIKDGVLVLDAKLEHAIMSGTTLPKGRAESELRACALHACEKILLAVKELSHGKHSINPVQLDYFLWGTLGKVPEYRAFPRPSCKETVFY